MSITGAEDGPPYKVGVALVDVLTGLHAAAAVLAALHGGEGARIEVPLLDSGLAGLVNVAQNALVTRRDPERHGNAHPNIVPYQDFETSSGRIAVAAANDGLFRALCSVMGLTSSRSDERFATNAGRVEHRGELVPLLAGALPRALGGGVAGRPRRRRRAGGQGAHRARRAGAAAAAGRAGDGDASTTPRRGRSTWWPRRSGAPRARTPTPPPLLGRAHGGGAGRAGPLRRARSRSWRRGAWSGSPPPQLLRPSALRRLRTTGIERGTFVTYVSIAHISDGTPRIYRPSPPSFARGSAAPGPPSASRRRSTPAAATPRPAR